MINFIDAPMRVGDSRHRRPLRGNQCPMILIVRTSGNPVAQRFHLSRSEARFGIRRAASALIHRVEVMRWMSWLASGLPATMAGSPESPPRTAASRTSKRSPASRDCSSAP